MNHSSSRRTEFAALRPAGTGFYRVSDQILDDLTFQTNDSTI
jgi:hypothetical protein